MSQEINCNLKLSIVASGNSKSSGELQWQEDAAGGSIGFEATIGSSSATAVSLGAGVTAPKIVYIQNNDLINYVVFDNVAGLNGWPQKVLPGTAAILRPPNGTLFAKADQAPVAVWIVAG
jgi:hypothetical protein